MSVDDINEFIEDKNNNVKRPNDTFTSQKEKSQRKERSQTKRGFGL